MVSDSCHSGGAAMSVVDSEDEDASKRNGTENGFQIREISPGQAKSHMDSLKEFYDKLKRELPAEPPPVAAEVLLLAACTDHQKTRDGDPHGLFTTTLLDVWNTDGPKTYRQLIERIGQKITDQNIPNITPVMVPISESAALGETEAFRI